MYYQPDIETMPREQLRELQLERMKQSVRHAYDNVAFYQRSFKEAGVEPGDLKTLEDLPKFPFVVKQDMRDAYPFGLFAVPQKDVARIHASSGTTGQATVVGHTASDLKNWGDCFARGIAMVGGDENSTIQVSTATACSRAAWGRTPAARPWAARSSPRRRATRAGRCR